MRRLRKIAKAVLRSIMVMILLLVLLLAGAWGALQLGAVREFLRTKLVDTLEKTLEQHVELSTINGQLPFHIEFDELAIRDEEGVWLRVDQFRFDLQASQLLRGRICLDDLSARRVYFARIPSVPTTNAPAQPTREPPKKSERRRMHVPWLLGDFSLNRIAIEQLQLGDGIVDMPTELSVDLRVLFNIKEYLLLKASVKRLDGLCDDLLVGLTLTNRLSEGSVQIEFDEGDDGLLCGMLGNKLNPIRLRVSGEGQVTNWVGEISARCGLASNRVAVSGQYCFLEKEQFTLDWSARQDVLPGRLVGGLQVRAPLSKPVLGAYATLEDLELSSLAQFDMEPLDVLFRAGYGNGYLDAVLVTTGSEYCAINGRGNIPAEIAFNPFVFDLGKDSPVDAQLNANINLALASPILQAFMQNIKGKLRSEINLAGTLGAPDLNGFIRMDDGLYENLKVGTILRDIDVDVEMEQDELRLKNVSAKDVANGVIKLTGGVDFSPAEKENPIQFRLVMTNAQLVSQTLVTLNAGADISLHGNHSHLVVEGTSRLERVLVNLQESLPPDVTDIQVVEVNKPGQRNRDVQPKKKEPAAAKRIDLDLAVLSSGKVFVKGRGLDSEWRTDIHVGGNAQLPRVTGDLSLVRGYFVFLGKRLELDQCSVTFDGGWPIVPQIDIRASTAATELIAHLRVYGPATNPKIELRSEPSRPQDEILSMMLFGKKPDELSATEALKIAYGINVLRGGVSGNGLLTKAQRTLGVDQVGIRQGSNEQTQLTIGKYIGNYIYIEGEKSLQGEGDAVTVDINLTRRLQLNTKASSEEGEGQSVYLRWHRDY